MDVHFEYLRIELRTYTILIEWHATDTKLGSKIYWLQLYDMPVFLCKLMITYFCACYVTGNLPLRNRWT